ncbi:MAG: di-heme oxidoredictase family protein [Saprospiraceae bacterium]
MRMKIIYILFVSAFVFILSMCRKPELFPDSSYDERLNGGSQTAFDATSHAFSHEFDGLSDYDLSIHEVGDAAFEQTFITAPANINNGLGTVFNNVSCISCHHKDGKGVPNAGLNESSLLMRISFPGESQNGGSIPVPGYGTQIQDKAVFGKRAEASVNITYSFQTYNFPDGTSYQLQAPNYSLTNLYTPISGNHLLSPRLAPPVFGLGLLEVISESDLVSRQDINDNNGDGISGKANYVWDDFENRKMLGRFGLKANTATILTQVAAAYNNDIGITSYVFPKETNHGQIQHDKLLDDPELADSILNAVKFYVQTLQVPARRNVSDPIIIKGKKIFSDAKCSSCHIPTMTTPVNVAFPQMSNQTIHPYTDLLVHDMGPGLADNRNDFLADGNEWRTAPLWGVGLFETVNYPAYYLHDGRARTLTEAIMWHDGEAANSRNYFAQLSTIDREALLKFLKSL